MPHVAPFVVEAYDSVYPLDLLSTSPTARTFWPRTSCCIYHAPYFAVQEKSSRRYAVVQGCCNHWDCPRCGPMVAAEALWAHCRGGATNCRTAPALVYHDHMSRKRGQRR